MKTHLFLIIAFILLTSSVTAQDKKASASLTTAIYEEEVTGNLDKAVELYLDILKKYPDDRQVAAKTLYHLGLVNEKMGKQKASEYFTRLVNKYPDQTEMVVLAKARLATLGSQDDKKGFVTRRILEDASSIGDILTKDGKYIRSLDGETGDLFQFEVATGQKNKIANKGIWSETDRILDNQVLSPDGKQIVYSSYYSQDWIPRLQIRNMDGSEVNTILSEQGCYNYPYDWSPDALSILALRTKDDIHNLVLISVKDGSTRVLSDIHSNLALFDKAAFSPDGRFIAFSYVRDDNHPDGDLFLITAEGKNEIIVARHPSEDRLIGWTPDGKSLLFLSDRSGTWDIWSVGINEGKQQGEPELLKHDFGYYSEVIGIAPDGSVYYRVKTRTGSLYKGSVDLETGRIIASPSPVATRYTGPIYNLSWSPDGKFLLYRSQRGIIGPGNNLITIRSEATGEERIVPTRLRFINQESWAPDGRSILAFGIAEKENGTFRIDPETGAINKLTGPRRFMPNLCPDGKILLCLKPGPVIIKINLETGDETELVKTGNIFWDLSHDGREILFQNEGIVKTISISGGEPKELIRGLAKQYGLNWTSDGRNVIVRALPDTDNENSRIWRIPAQGGAPVKLDLSVPNLVSFRLHPDNSRFVFSVVRVTKSELWVLENFLPK